MKRTALVRLAVVVALVVSATVAMAAPKTETHELATYVPPAGWQRTTDESGSVMFVRVDEKAGAAGLITVAKTLETTSDARGTFDAAWKRVVEQPDVPAPTVGKAVKRNGWDVIRGSAKFRFEGHPATMTLVSATRGTANVVVVVTMINTAFQKQGDAFIASLRFAAPPAKATTTTATTVATTTTTAAPAPAPAASATVDLSGAWGFSSGGAMGPGQWAAWLRDCREYNFDGKGGYVFLRRLDVDRDPDTSIIRERGTYVLSGDQLTLTPTKAEREIWGITRSGPNGGKYTTLTKREKVVLENTTYRVSYEMYPNTNVTNLMLTPGAATEREGKFNATTSYRFFRPDGKYYTAIAPTP